MEGVEATADDHRPVFAIAPVPPARVDEVHHQQSVARQALQRDAQLRWRGGDLERLAAVEPRRPKTTQALHEATAVSVGVYVSRDDDWERAGIDASAFVNLAPPEPDRR